MTITVDVNVTFYHISTHTPLAGRDYNPFYLVYLINCISTHTPLAGRDRKNIHSKIQREISTHTPLAGRDDYDENIELHLANFYSHVPCGT